MISHLPQHGEQNKREEGEETGCAEGMLNVLGASLGVVIETRKPFWFLQLGSIYFIIQYMKIKVSRYYKKYKFHLSCVSIFYI